MMHKAGASFLLFGSEIRSCTRPSSSEELPMGLFLLNIRPSIQPRTKCFSVPPVPFLFSALQIYAIQSVTDMTSLFIEYIRSFRHNSAALQRLSIDN